MSWADFPDARHSVSLLRRSIERGRLGHAYLFSGDSPDLLERIARELAATVNCTGNPTSSSGLPETACGTCTSCQRIQKGQHPDLHWLRAESKLRVIRVEQVRELMNAMHLKSGEARFKVGVIVDADRLNSQAANAFLKTLEEPPPRSLLILLSTQPDRIIETILSRCLRLAFPGEGGGSDAPVEWLQSFATELQQPAPSLLQRYRLLDILNQHLAGVRSQIETEVKERWSAQRVGDPDPELLERWEDEVNAAIEAEYRRRRGHALGSLQSWLRDVWLVTLGQPEALLAHPHLASQTRKVAQRLDPARARANIELFESTQRTLQTNVQEALALEVAILRAEF